MVNQFHQNGETSATGPGRRRGSGLRNCRRCGLLTVGVKFDNEVDLAQGEIQPAGHLVGRMALAGLAQNGVGGGQMRLAWIAAGVSAGRFRGSLRSMVASGLGYLWPNAVGNHQPLALRLKRSLKYTETGLDLLPPAGAVDR